MDKIYEPKTMLVAYWTGSTFVISKVCEGHKPVVYYAMDSKCACATIESILEGLKEDEKVAL